MNTRARVHVHVHTQCSTVLLMQQISTLIIFANAADDDDADTVALQDGRLQAGDQLLAVNGRSLVGVEQEV